MELVELKQKTTQDLKTVLAEQRVVLRVLQFQTHEGQLKQVHTIKKTKKIIAQILTLLNAQNAQQ
ncbi:MAG: 50S ribosomal protein L29 [Candidatus Magasanikbacteria bacterium CG_4_9_14_0_2_um_filter_42_11]|uniref:Large ribosomal subunit protein uL29 n=1 Tax=Candidatus Magasanikbacteria bacterium CG_4_9_14_0_2_um_filter_42_11 TaxID=1974643 RepID=A0A2M8F8M3_9BACT|nr:MAG: 50S ribosomal protein L29 [Candidatus Magasanikbacteria bacterium CG10_big_fil_rev_8_21_14_0_10_43_9]PIY92453.1 MAG: 50S ribosomal protein L29 [Candidatus Magasanikbacteria bacterium CG_4_10_14_0_8_um_filter_42_12]PJC52067.1 MAG: 50S ribosomal protein L29 [Candidatus Magasanikbacteria bacterium CG_4_9_14_0_2_um_filter_42_11]